jgi:hypothetical protein
MRATIVGKTRCLSIYCENSDKRFLGDVHIEGRGAIHEALVAEGAGEGAAGRLPQHVDGFVRVYAQQSEALRRALVVRNLGKQYQDTIDQYAHLRTLTTFDRDGAKLFISVMLNAIDFNFFASFVEANFFSELEYVIDVPFYSLPETREAQAEATAKFGYILPTELEFRSGKPCFFPNVGISFGFEHAASNRGGRTSVDGF